MNNKDIEKSCKTIQEMMKFLVGRIDGKESIDIDIRGAIKFVYDTVYFHTDRIMKENDKPNLSYELKPKRESLPDCIEMHLKFLDSLRNNIGYEPKPKYEIGQEVWSFVPGLSAQPKNWRVVENLIISGTNERGYYCSAIIKEKDNNLHTYLEKYLYPTLGQALNAQIEYLESLKEETPTPKFKVGDEVYIYSRFFSFRDIFKTKIKDIIPIKVGCGEMWDRGEYKRDFFYVVCNVLIEGDSVTIADNEIFNSLEEAERARDKFIKSIE
jgi:hypothetical protein